MDRNGLEDHEHMSLAEDILAADDLPMLAVEVPEWPVKVVHVRTLSGTEYEAFEKAVHGEKPGSPMVMARAAAASVCLESGELIFSEADIPALAKKSSKPQRRLFKAFLKLNGTDDEAIKELEKN